MPDATPAPTGRNGGPCKRCGAATTRRRNQFCSPACHYAWVREHPETPSAELVGRRRARALAKSRWSAMWSRCTRPDDPRYPRYGGRGITVCDEWRDFATYYRDIGDAPLSDVRMSLDRIDNDGPYAPWNVRWASYKEQAANSHNVHSAKTHCPYGHPYDDENTWVDTARGWRQCRTCSRRRNREQQRRAKGARVDAE